MRTSLRLDCFRHKGLAAQLNFAPVWYAGRVTEA
jgi:hypothetical protein